MAEGWIVPKLWKGERVFVIAGGPTARELKDYPVSYLPGKSIAIKDAALLLPLADIFFYAEKHFQRLRPDIWAAYLGPLRVKRTVHDKAPQGVLQVARQKVGNDRPNGLSLNPGLLGGHCSGGSALNLAFHLGAAEIVLIGYDLTGHHWNEDGGHPFPNAPRFIHERHAASIDAMAAPLAAAGVKVWNVSSTSRLRSFKRAPLKTFL